MVTRKINKLDVARYYLKSELGYALPELGRTTDFDEIDAKQEDEIMRLGEALATYYRSNAVWFVIADPLFEWTEEEVPVSHVRMTGMGDDTSITDLIYSEQVQNNPIKLKLALSKYYSVHRDDPYKVKPNGKKIKLSKVLIVDYKGELRLLDGSHRFIEQLMSGKDRVTAYVARSSKQPSVIRPMVGDGFFRVLARASKSVSAADKDLLYNTAKLMKDYAYTNDSMRHFKPNHNKAAKNG